MKIKDAYIIRDIAGETVVVPTGSEAAKFNGIITLNATGAFLFRRLKKGAKQDELIAALRASYDVGEQQAENDVREFINTIKERRLLEEDDR